MDLWKEESRSIVKVPIVDSEGECERKGLGVVCPASCKGGCIKCKYTARYNVNRLLGIM